MNNISIESATQLNKILFFLPENKKTKITKNIWKIINDKTDNNISTRINEVSDIKQVNISSETRKYLSFIFLNYLATEEEKKEYIKIIKNNEEQYQKFLNKKYRTDDIFNKKKTFQGTMQENKEGNKLPIKRKKGFFEIIINKIKKLFQKGR